MNDELIVFELPDGAIRVTTCPLKGKRPGEIRAVWLNRIFLQDILGNPAYAGARRIANPVMPDGQQFRPGAPKLFYGAWKHAGGGRIEIDMPRARAIKREDIRWQRNLRFATLDARWMRAVGQKDQALADATEAKRQILRDIPATAALDTITDAEDLAAFQPSWPVATAAAVQA